MRKKKLYQFQFGFRSKHSTSHALISLTEKMRDTLDKNLFACKVFIDLHKAFDTVNHNILISKLEYHGICEIPLAWFKSSSHNRFQYISVTGTESELLLIKHAVFQGSILEPLLYINDLCKAITFSKIHHLADGTNFLYESPSLKDINKKINYYMSRVTHWLRANRIFFNVAKTEIILFCSCRIKITKKLNFRISG